MLLDESEDPKSFSVRYADFFIAKYKTENGVLVQLYYTDLFGSCVFFPYPYNS